MYYDLLAKIKNAVRAEKESFQTSFSKSDFEVARTLVRLGFLKQAEKRVVGRKQYLEIRPEYAAGAPTLSGFTIISKPGKRVYIGYRDLMPVRQGFGVGILSTPNGIMTNREARKQKLGGEYLFKVW